MIKTILPTYLDNASTTKVDIRVLGAMLLYFSEIYSNALSNHYFGKESKQAIELSRKQVSKLINCNEGEIIFTAVATESINFVLKGHVESNFEKGNSIIAVNTKHKSGLGNLQTYRNKRCWYFV